MNHENTAVSVGVAAKRLEESGELFIELFRHGTLSVEFYRPDKVDNQKPHDRDEIYVVATGDGSFFQWRKKVEFQTR